MSLSYKQKYYEIRRTAKQLLFENHALQNEIVECKQKTCQRERERELLLQHLLEYEQEEWELQREMANASNDKNKTIKKQQGYNSIAEADKRKKMRADTMATSIIETPTITDDTTGKKIPKIKIVFQQKPGSQETPKAVPSTPVAPPPDIQPETRILIKNKLKRNKPVSKIEPIVISLPTSVMQNQDSKDSALQQLMKKHRPNSMVHPGLSMSQSLDTSSMHQLPSSAMMSLAGSMMSSVMAGTHHSMSHSSSTSSVGLSPCLTSPSCDPQDSLSHTPDNTPIDVFSESENSCNVSPCNSGSDVSHMDNTRSDYKNLTFQDENSNSMPSIQNEFFEPAQFTVPSDFSWTSSSIMKKSTDGFKISPSTLRNIKQKIDSINAKTLNMNKHEHEQAMLKKAFCQPSTSSPKKSDNG